MVEEKVTFTETTHNFIKVRQNSEQLEAPQAIWRTLLLGFGSRSPPQPPTV